LTTTTTKRMKRMSDDNGDRTAKPGVVVVQFTYYTMTGECHATANIADEVLLRGIVDFALESLIKGVRDKASLRRILPASTLPPGARSV
jgi:hypothetical protein